MARQSEDNGASIFGAQSFTFSRNDSSPSSGSYSKTEEARMVRNTRKIEASSFPHIVTQRNVEEAATESEDDNPFIQHSSAEPLIKEQLAERAKITHNQSINKSSLSLDIDTTLPRPATFAQATMSTNVHTRGKSSIANDDRIHSRNTSMGSMPGSKLKLKKKKWTPFPLGDISGGGGSSGHDTAAVDNASDTTDFPDVSGSDFELSRPATPSINTYAHAHAHGHAHAYANGTLQSTSTPSNPTAQPRGLIGGNLDVPDTSKSAETLSGASNTPEKPCEKVTTSTTDLDDNLDILPTPTQKDFIPLTAIEFESISKSSSKPSNTDTYIQANSHAMNRDLDHLSMAGIAQAFSGNDATVIKIHERKEHAGISTSHSFAASNRGGSKQDSGVVCKDFATSTSQHFGYGSNTFKSPLSSRHASAITPHRANSYKEEVAKESTTLPISSQVRGPDKPTARDDFDSMDWDPSMAFGMDDSPGPVAAQPKKVEYTTVGSLVNSNSIPQFTAPNRIQREGSVRRSAMAMQPVGGYQMGSYYQSQYHTSPYGQQFSQNPVNAQFALSHTSDSVYGTYAHNSRSNQPLNSLRLADQEIGALCQRSQGFPSMQANKIMYPSCNTHRLHDQQGNAEFPRSFPDHLTRGLDTQDVTEDAGDFQQDRGTLLGMSKMHTLQSLSKFDNPMRNIAQSRLQKLLVTSPVDPGAAVETLLRNKITTSSTTVPKISDLGELNRSYQFPSRPPGLGGPSSVQSNPLYGVLAPSTSMEDAPPARGPQPLTAGPPGQRSNPPVTKFGANSIDSLWSNDPLGYAHGPNNNSYGYMGTAAYGSEIPSAELNPGPAVPRTRIVDTLDAAAAAKYYPNGRVPDVYQPLGFIEQLEMGRGRKLSEEEKTALNVEKIVYDNYEGQRRFSMTFDDYDEELRQRQMMVGWGQNRPGPIQPPSRVNELKPIVVAEMDNMPLVEAARPLFQAAYGSLLRYIDPSPASDKLKSGYEASAEHLLDRSEEGNKSFFGEDWGKPKIQRVGRDPRYGTRGFSKA